MVMFLVFQVLMLLSAVAAGALLRNLKSPGRSLLGKRVPAWVGPRETGLLGVVFLLIATLFQVTSYSFL